MIFGAIVAGGTGTRMNAQTSICFENELPDVPKQFLPLKKRPMIYYSIDKFLSVDKIDMLFIGVHADYRHYLETVIDGYFSNFRDKIVAVTGGADRNETLMNIINEAEKMHGVSEDDYIITHDAVRPFVTVDMIEQNIELVQKYGAVDTVCPCIDTVVVSGGGEYIDTVPKRSTLYNGQTPQSFNMQKLKKLYMQLSNEDKTELTDACKIFSQSGERVYFAKGDSMNIKITTKSDYFIAAALAEYLL